VDVVLVQGVGPSPLSMLLLGYRLRKSGYKVHLFAYRPTFPGLEGTSTRLRTFTQSKKTGESRFFVLGVLDQSRRLRSFSDTCAVKERPKKAKKPKSFIFSPLLCWLSLD
jgi:hypothetical protein